MVPPAGSLGLWSEFSFYLLKHPGTVPSTSSPSLVAGPPLGRGPLLFPARARTARSHHPTHPFSGERVSRSPLASGRAAVTTVRSSPRWPRARSPQPRAGAGRWAGPGRGEGRRRARRRLGEDESPRPQKLSEPARGRGGRSEEASLAVPPGAQHRSRAATMIPERRFEDGVDGLPRRRRAPSSRPLLHPPAVRNPRYRARLPREDTNSLLFLSCPPLFSSLLALAPEAKTRP